MKLTRRDFVEALSLPFVAIGLGGTLGALSNRVCRRPSVSTVSSVGPKSFRSIPVDAVYVDEPDACINGRLMFGPIKCEKPGKIRWTA